MSDLDNLLALKKLIENKGVVEEDPALTREKKFIADATRAYLGGDESNRVQNYKPGELIAFLSGPIQQVQSKMGGEWAQMDILSFESFAYSMKQKLQKSTSLINWNS